MTATATAAIAQAVALALLALAGAWDLYVVRHWGLASGRTASWQLFTAARRWPALPFLAGYAAHWLGFGHEVAFLAALVLGHIFGTMSTGTGKGS